MAMFKHMVDMRRTAEEKAEERLEMMTPPAVSEIPDVPYGLRICLTEDELEKLGIDLTDPDDACEVGCTIHLFCMAQVTSVSRNETENGVHERVELSIVSMAAESEDAENEEAEAEEVGRRR